MNLMMLMFQTFVQRKKEEIKMNGKEFIRATDAICKEKGIDKDIIFEAMKTALEKAYAKHTGFSNIRIDIA